MRNRVLICAILASAVPLATLAAGQDPTTTGSEKLGIINIQQAIAATGEGKKALTDLQKKYEPKRQELQRQQDEVSALTDQLQKQSATLSDEERGRLSRDLDEKQRALKRMQEDDQSDYQADTQDAVQRIGQKMVKVIDGYAQKNGYSLVMDVSQGVNVFYVAKGVDITDPIVKLYDEANPSPAGASASASRAPKAAASKPKP